MIVIDVNRDRYPVLFDIVFEEKHILLEFAEHHEGPIFGEVGTRNVHLILIVVDRVTWVSHNNGACVDDTLTWLELSNTSVISISGGTA